MRKSLYQACLTRTYYRPRGGTIHLLEKDLFSLAYPEKTKTLCKRQAHQLYTGVLNILNLCSMCRAKADYFSAEDLGVKELI